MTLSAYRAGGPPTIQTEPPSPSSQRLSRASLSGPAVATARWLLGRLIVRDDGAGLRTGRIVETEAYAGPSDQASHARAGRTPRTSVMFGPPGRAYVYFVYGMHHCLNVVCGPDGEAAAVLIRGVEPVAGVAAMRAARGHRTDPVARLAAGPARACQALGIDRTLDGVDLVTDARLWLADDGMAVPEAMIVSGPRVGVEYAGPEWASRPWRFGLSGSPALSRPFPPHD